jgi:hypothetical protein
MSRLQRPGVTAFSLLCFLVLPAVANGQSALLDEVLLAATSPSPVTFRAAEQAWQGQQDGAADILTKYAMALAFASNNRYPQAFELMEGIPYVARKAGPLRRLYVWLTVKLKKDELAANEIQSLVEELGARSQQKPSEKDIEDVVFVGKLVAYFHHVAERDEPLEPAKAKDWWLVLTSLPAEWRGELLAIEQAEIAGYQKREKELRDTYNPWRQKTDADLAAIQHTLAGLAVKEAAATTDLTTAVNNWKALRKSFEPQLDDIEREERRLEPLKRSLGNPPTPPRKPSKGKDGKPNPAEERRYDREEREYEAKRREYDRKKSSLDREYQALSAKRNAINQQLAPLQAIVNQKQAALVKIQVPRQQTQNKELAIQKLLTDRPRWDTPGSLSTLRSLDAYVSIDMPTEVARIRAARSR